MLYATLLAADDALLICLLVAAHAVTPCYVDTLQGFADAATLISLPCFLAGLRRHCRC